MAIANDTWQNVYVKVYVDDKKINLKSNIYEECM